MSSSGAGTSQSDVPMLAEAPYVSAGPVTIVNADLDGDGTLDVAVLDATSGRVVVWLGDARTGLARAETNSRGGRLAELVVRERLTRREREVMALLASGHTDREIAAALGIGRRTAETHTASVLAKVGVSSRRELMRRRWPNAATGGL